MEYILSIGLNVGDSEPADQLSATLIALAKYARIIDIKMGAAEWMGVPERFIQVRAESNTPYVAAQGMALDLQQEAIAVLHKGDPYWYLVYADGRSLQGASVKDFPVILGAELNAADCRAELEAAAESTQMDEHGPRCAQRFIGAAECTCGKAESDAAAESADNERFPREDWEYEVECKYTRLDYSEWLMHKMEDAVQDALRAEYAPIAIGKLDDRPHGAVQAWSRGPIFPFVIVRSEVDEFPTWRAINGPGGAQTSSYFSHDACERAAMDHLEAIGGNHA